MTSQAQQKAVRRYESSGKRPGKKITLRLTDEQAARAEAWRQQGEPLAAAIKRRLFDLVVT